MSVVTEIVKETLKALARDYKNQGERAFRSGILALVLQVVQSVRLVFVMMVVCLIGAILFSLSLFEVVRDAFSADGQYLILNWRGVLGDVFFWLMLASAGVIYMGLRQRSWLDAFKVNHQLRRIYGIKDRPAQPQRTQPAAAARTDGVTTVDDLAERQRRVFHEGLEKKAASVR